MKLRLLFLSLFFSVYAYSQYDYKPGYIVKPDGNTEEGLINFHGSEFNGGKCEFKKDAKSEPVVYLPTDITAYRLINSKYFVSKKIFIENVETNIFLECLISGKATIYYTKWNSKDIFFLEKDGKLTEMSNNTTQVRKDGIPYESSSNQYIGVLKYNFQDCPLLTQKIDNADFTKKSMINLSKEYHEYVCKDEECIIYEKKISKRHLLLGLDLSYSALKLEFAKNMLGFSLDPVNQCQVSITAQMNLDEECAYYLQFSLGYYLYKNEFLNYDELIGSSMSLPNDIYYEFSVLKPALQVKYKAKIKKIVPFASAGMFTMLFLTDKGEIYHRAWDESMYFSSGEFKRSNNFMLGGIGEIGFETGLKPGNISFSLLGEYYTTNPFRTSYSLGLKCGYYFDL